MKPSMVMVPRIPSRIAAALAAWEEAPWKRELAGVVLLVGLGALLRFWGLGQMEFKYDEWESLNLGQRLLEARPWVTDAPWPQVGLPSSGGIYNPPLFNWLIALFWSLTGTPVGCAALIALANVLALPAIYLWARRALGAPRALLALGWLALSPYAVIYSRKLWPPELLLPGVTFLLWGVEHWRAGRLWLGGGLLLWAGLFFSQLHLSGPVFLAVLVVVLVVGAIRCGRAGRPALVRPRSWEAVVAVAGLGAVAFFTLPYLGYLANLSPQVLREGVQLTWPEPQLLFRLVTAVVPLELEGHFSGHWAQFLHSPSPAAWLWLLRWVGLIGAVYTSVPLALRGAYGWIRRPGAVPVLGVSWIGFLLLFSLLQRPAFTQYALVLFPLPALLIAGAFDLEKDTDFTGRVWHLLRWAHLGLLGMLTFGTVAWVTARGGSAGDYGVGFGCREREAQAIIAALKNQDPAPFESAPRSAFRSPCHAPGGEIRWIVHDLAPEMDARLDGARVCEGWLSDGKDDLQFRWAVER